MHALKKSGRAEEPINHEKRRRVWESPRTPVRRRGHEIPVRLELANGRRIAVEQGFDAILLKRKFSFLDTPILLCLTSI